VANPRTAKPPASKAVFVNCPFDDEFKPTLRAIVFTVIASGYHPRSALDATDGAEVRLGKIAAMIGECDWGIHDLSRVEVEVGGVPRFNMPMELGIVRPRAPCHHPATRCRAPGDGLVRRRGMPPRRHGPRERGAGLPSRRAGGPALRTR
jgi:hypothetical protein